MSAVGRSLVAVAVLVLAATAPAVVAQETPDRVVVDASGDGDYESIAAALAAVESGTTIEVRPGTYEESVRIEKDVRLLAPGGATLDGSATTGATAGIRIVGDAAPEIAGFSIKEYRVGIDASDTSGDWVVQETRIVNSRVIGIRASGATGDWTVLDTAIRDTDGIALGAFRTRGNWSVIGVSVTGTDGVGVNARHATGDWRIVGSLIAETTNGTTLPARATGTGVRAVGTRGSWEITQTVFRNNSLALNATRAQPAGTATGVYWTDGPDCVGNADCGSPLESRPSNAGVPNATTPPSEPDEESGGLPFSLLGVGALVAAVGGTAVAVRTLGRNAVIDRIEAAGAVVLGVSALVADSLPVGGDSDADAHRIVVANVDSQPVSCRVRCRTGDGVEFEYDLQLDPDERREARELPGGRPFELTVQVDGGSTQETFENPTDVGVRVANRGAELTT